jgi:hypothetical protein
MTAAPTPTVAEVTIEDEIKLPAPLIEGHGVKAYPIEDGALVDVPIYEHHSRGKNWLAVIAADPAAPGGLGRAFVARGNGRYYYRVGALKPGQAIEFAGDYYGGSGSKSPRRLYAVVREVRPDTLIIEVCKTSTEAIKLARTLAESATTIDRSALAAERERLVARLAEIDGLLAVVPA